MTGNIIYLHIHRYFWMDLYLKELIERRGRSSIIRSDDSRCEPGGFSY